MLEHDHLDHVLIVFARLYEPLPRSAAFPLKVAATVIVRARTAGMRTRWVPLGAVGCRWVPALAPNGYSTYPCPTTGTGAGAATRFISAQVQQRPGHPLRA